MSVNTHLKYLLIRFSSIGDIIFTTPLPEWLKNNDPDCIVHFLTLSEYTPLLENNPFIDKIIQINRNHSRNKLKQIANIIRGSGYDLVVDLHNSLRSKILRYDLAGISTSVYKKPRWKRFLLFYFHLNRLMDHYDISRKYIQVIDYQQDDSIKLIPKIFLSNQEIIRVREFLSLYGVKKEFIVFVPGSAWPNKIWKFKGYIETIRTFLEEQTLDVVLLGGKNDVICDIISEQIKGVKNLKGKSNLRMSLAILSLAQTAVGSDTGLIHGSEAVGTNVVMIKGPTSKATGASTHLTNSIELKTNLWCRPCSKNGSRPCYRKKQLCMDSITSSQVIEAINIVTPIATT